MSQGGIGHQRGEGAFQFAEVGLDAGGQESEDVFAQGNAFPHGAGAEHLQAGGVVRAGEFGRQAPLEAGQQPFFEVLQVCGGAVTGENELLAALVQMVEDVEESILGTLAHQVLDVVYDEDVDALVKRDEVHDAVALDGVHVLGFELVAGDVQHLEAFFEFDADGLGDVRFPQPRTAEEEERVEGGFARCHGNAFPGAHTQFVAFSLDEVSEAVHRVQARVDPHALRAREYKGTGIAGGLKGGNGHRIVGGHGPLPCRQHHAFAVLDRTHQVEQLGVGADGAADGEADQVLETFFQIFAEKSEGTSTVRRLPSSDTGRMSLNQVLNCCGSVLLPMICRQLFHTAICLSWSVIPGVKFSGMFWC